MLIILALLADWVTLALLLFLGSTCCSWRGIFQQSVLFVSQKLVWNFGRLLVLIPEGCGPLSTRGLGREDIWHFRPVKKFLFSHIFSKLYIDLSRLVLAVSSIIVTTLTLAESFMLRDQDPRIPCIPPKALRKSGHKHKPKSLKRASNWSLWHKSFSLLGRMYQFYQ